ncbi:hypothetical protein [Phaffia rhodozyma]|uniref:Uncharacterized protein n=1 Tax=Phaffia rhodozyma TaxID=264483 RepID=A0A0F7SK48_PHARH|nr:hypothetical protein [Phaffia rhodozyma]
MISKALSMEVCPPGERGARFYDGFQICAYWGDEAGASAWIEGAWKWAVIGRGEGSELERKMRLLRGGNVCTFEWWGVGEEKRSLMVQPPADSLNTDPSTVKVAKLSKGQKKSIKAKRARQLAKEAFDEVKSDDQLRS